MQKIQRTKLQRQNLNAVAKLYCLCQAPLHTHLETQNGEHWEHRDKKQALQAYWEHGDKKQALQAFLNHFRW
jgi:hypothetical protein